MVLKLRFHRLNSLVYETWYKQNHTVRSVLALILLLKEYEFRHHPLVLNINPQDIRLPQLPTKDFGLNRYRKTPACPRYLRILKRVNPPHLLLRLPKLLSCLLRPWSFPLKILFPFLLSPKLLLSKKLLPPSTAPFLSLTA